MQSRLLLAAAALSLISQNAFAATWPTSNTCLASSPADSGRPELSFVATNGNDTTGAKTSSVQLRLKTPKAILPNNATANGVTVEIAGQRNYEGLTASGAQYANTNMILIPIEKGSPLLADVSRGESIKVTIKGSEIGEHVFEFPLEGSGVAMKSLRACLSRDG